MLLRKILMLMMIAPAVQAMTLKDAFKAARSNMETLKRADANIDQREEQKNRARAALLPNINGVGTYTKIDRPSASGVSSAFTLTKQYSFGIRATQPLIRGGVLGALDVARENILLAEFQKDASEINLYQLVISGYYSLQVSFADVKNLESFLKLSKQRVAEIRERTKIGRSRKGELVEAQAQLHNAESQYQQGLIQLEADLKNFEFLTKSRPKELPPLSSVPRVDGKLSQFLAKVRKRPDIMANQQQIKVAAGQVSIAKGSHYPSVDLVGNYYFDRTGILATSEWDAGVVISVPLFQGGGTVASVREAVATKRIAELNAAESLRTAERDVSVLYQNYLQLQLQLDALKKALEKSEEAYRLNKKDYEFGLVTNLDVLVSLNNYIQNKRAYDGLFATAHMTYRNLEAATGVLP